METKCSDGENIPSKGDPIYQWPEDLLQPSAVIFLELDEETRSQRIRERVDAETREEKKLKEDSLLRQRLQKAYENMENTRWIKIDASKSKEKVYESAIKELKNFVNLAPRVDDKVETDEINAECIPTVSRNVPCQTVPQTIVQEEIKGVTSRLTDEPGGNVQPPVSDSNPSVTPTEEKDVQTTTVRYPNRAREKPNYLGYANKLL